MKVKSIDVYGIEDRLRKSKNKEDKDVYGYIKSLKQAYKRQQDLTNTAISKLRSYSKNIIKDEPINDYQLSNDGSYMFDKREFYLIDVDTHIIIAQKKSLPSPN